MNDTTPKGLLESLQDTANKATAAATELSKTVAEVGKRLANLESEAVSQRKHVDGLRFIVSEGRVGAKDDSLTVVTPNPVPGTPAPVPPPAPVPSTVVYTIVDFKLAANGIVQDDTNGVIQVGTLAGFTHVHKNSGGDWYGKSASGVWTHLSNRNVNAIGVPLVPPAVDVGVVPSDGGNAVIIPPPATTTELLTIIDGQLVVNGQVQTDTANVVQVGAALGYLKVHLNTSNEWYGADKAGKWSQLSPSTVTPIGDRVEIAIKPVDVSAGKAIWARQYPKASTGYKRGTPPAAIKRTLWNYTEDPLWVDPYFSGNHVQTGVPQWLRNGEPQAAIIPAPTYRYGYSRSLHANGNEADDPTFWWQVEKVKGQYYWNDVDAWVKAIGDSHPLIVNVYGTPTFYQKYPGERSKWPHWHGLASPPTDGEGLAAYEKFVRAFVTRYGKKIAGMENWNEPNFGGMNANSRWSPSITNQNNNAPFFSGTPVDLAKMQRALFNGLKGTSTLALSPAFTDEYGGPGKSQAELFLNTETGYGQAKKFTEGFACHHYDYDIGTDALSNMRGYRDMLKRVGLNVDIFNSETGAEIRAVFTSKDAATRAPKRITYWGFAMAALGFRSCIFYGHLNKAGRLKHLGDTVDTQTVVQALNLVNSIGGKVIREAAELTDGRIWLRFDDNTEITSL